MIDLTFDRKSTSEGQSYGLFFALVANEREQFDTILDWTSDNLADGQLGDKLPGWLWGEREDGSWGIKDKNSASDADLWIAYSLLEAARVWDEPRYAVTGRKLLAQIQQHEIVSAGKAGQLLLPGAYGFELGKGRFRINPSYLPEFMFRYLSMVDPTGPWQAVWDSYLRITPQVYSAGVAPDLFVVDSRGRVTPDSERQPSGSYDAIRVYMWAGMSVSRLEKSSGEKSNDEHLLRALLPFADLIRKFGNPPERINPHTGAATKSDFSPLGFSGAVLPYLAALDEDALLETQRKRLQVAAIKAELGATTHYYDQMLILFGQGWLDGWYRFDSQGRVQLKWMQ